MIALCAAYCFLPYTMLASSIVKPKAIYSYEQMRADLLGLQARYQGALRVEVFGYSREGRPLYAAIVGSAGCKRAVLMHASIHAREHMTTTLVMMQLERMLKLSPPRDVCFYIVPMVNPDGVRISQLKKGNALQRAIYNKERMSGRTNASEEEYFLRWKANAAGVDLNRNFPAGFERINNAPASASENYKGAYALSEPESLALKNLSESRSFDATISYHATGSEIYYAFGDAKQTNQAGLSFAKALNKALRYEIKPDRGVSFGGYKDWAILKKGVPSLTIEIGKGSAPLLPGEWQDIWRRNKNIPYAAAKWLKKHLGVWF